MFAHIGTLSQGRSAVLENSGNMRPEDVHGPGSLISSNVVVLEIEISDLGCYARASKYTSGGAESDKCSEY